ncbi:MAG: sodium-translocating pyrophosphatase [Myxococcales bacterium]|nr:sodium-translocating pyrophosphatase [Myxococcales bacterium]MBK7197207.1 sodium-translocating pyrophosphatase [Myxococcales bacterium]
MLAILQAAAAQAAAGPGHGGGGHQIHSEADLVLPNLHTGVPEGATGAVKFLGMSGWSILAAGLVVCMLAMVFGMVIYRQLKNMPVHKSMREVSELIYETCKTYLETQGKFIALLWVFVGTIIVVYFGALEKVPAGKVAAIAGFSIIGILGSYGVAWFGIRVNTFANSRAAFASLRGKPYPTYAIPLKAGMSIGTMLIAVELLLMLAIMLFLPGDYAGPCFIGFAVGESLGAAALRIAGGIFTKIADIGSDLMKIVFNIKEDDARNPGVIADCTGDNAGDSVGPTADGFETYGVTGVALITFILIALSQVTELQTILLVWIFTMRIAMVIASIGSYLINENILTKPKYQNADKMDFEHPLTVLVWLTSIVAVGLTFLISYFLIGPGASSEFALNGQGDIGTNLGWGLWWKLSVIISCGTLAGAIIPETVKVFTSTRSGHVREVVTASRQGGASLNVLAGLTAGNFSGYWMGIAIVSLMGIAYGVSTLDNSLAMLITAGSHGQIAGFAATAAAAVFAFGLVAFGFLGMGPVTIAVDSYGPVTDNAQSVYELSVIETLPGIEEEIQKDFGFKPNWEKGKHFLEENDGAGNTFKATAKPVLIGTAVVGAATMIFAIIMLLTDGLQADKIRNLSMLHPPFLLGLITGGAVIYWFTGASTQAVSTGAYRAVEYIKANIKLDSGATKASIEDSKKVVEICTKYAQKGMINIFFTLFFSTLAFACLEPYFFIGYLISMALFGLYQAIFMANAGGAWDNAKKVVEVELKEKGTELHAASVVGDTVGDPFKDTSSVALNPVIKFTTLFGVLAVGLSLKLSATTNHVIAAVGFVISAFFVYRSFYGMRIDSGK